MAETLRGYVLADLTEDQKLKLAIEQAVLAVLKMNDKTSECRLSRQGELYAVDKELLFGTPKNDVTTPSSDQLAEIKDKATAIKNEIALKLHELSNKEQHFRVMAVDIKPIEDPDTKAALVGLAHMPHLVGKPHHIIAPFSVHIDSGSDKGKILGYGHTVEIRLTGDLAPIVYNARFPALAKRSIPLRYSPIEPKSNGHSHPGGGENAPIVAYSRPVPGCNFMVPGHVQFDGHHVHVQSATINSPVLNVLETRSDARIQLVVSVLGSRIRDWTFQLEVLFRQSNFPGQLKISDPMIGPGPHILPIGACEVAILAESKSTGILLTSVRQFYSSMSSAAPTDKRAGLVT
ncbi:MAG: hypothetical protein ABL949_03590 [Fimbriimonadaceae bacterium]